MGGAQQYASLLEDTVEKLVADTVTGNWGRAPVPTFALNPMNFSSSSSQLAPIEVRVIRCGLFSKSVAGLSRSSGNQQPQ